MKRIISIINLSFIMITFGAQIGISADELKGKNGSKIDIDTPLIYINTLFENGSPLFWHIMPDGKIRAGN